MIAHRVEGIIFAAPQTRRRTSRRSGPSCRCGPPVVFLKSEPSPAFSTIVIDNYGGARLATEHLLALGRRRIGHLAGPLPWREARDRHDGWRDALRDAGRRARPRGAAATWSPESGEAGFERLLALDSGDRRRVRRERPDGPRRAPCARARGIGIPDDLAVVGFDGLDEAAHFTPSLTTVVQPLRELGELAVREVLSIANEANGPAPFAACPGDAAGRP